MLYRDIEMKCTVFLQLLLPEETVRFSLAKSTSMSLKWKELLFRVYLDLITRIFYALQ